MAATFIGHSSELTLLRKRLDRVASSGSATAVALRGRRQVGKSRLVQEFCDRAEVPYVYFAATKGASPVESVAAFLADLRDSSLPTDRELVPANGSGSWSDAFRVLAAVLPPTTPCIVVLDELPWLAEQDDIFDGALQTAWDRLLSRHPVLLLLGSDIHMMARLTGYDRPFFGRADNLVLGPLTVAETGAATGLGPADAIDAHLISGGLPGILRSWPHGTPPLSFLADECGDPAAPLFSVPESALMAEFPAADQARRVLEAVGGGDRTHANIAAAAGGRQGAIPSGSLSPLLRRLVEDKRVLAVDQPLSTQPGKPALYRVADSNLRLYLAALRSAHEQARRGRPEVAFRVVQRRWAAWRGRAVEPLIRQALELAAAAGELPWPELEAVGGWWNRRFDPEIDLVGADRRPVARRILSMGSIKWLASPFDGRDLADLARGALRYPASHPAAPDWPWSASPSTISWHGWRSPLTGSGAMGMRSSGASVTSVVNAHRHRRSGVKSIVLNDHHRSWFPCAVLATGCSPDLAAPHALRSVSQVIASTNVWSAAAWSLRATAWDCWCAAIVNSGDRTSGTQI